MQRRTFICVVHRHVAKSTGILKSPGHWRHYTPTCPRCRAPMTDMGRNWRPPAKDNDRAWKLIARGHPLWDEKALSGVYFGVAWRAVPPKVLRRNRDRSIRPTKGVMR
jgi:hypothetical protein